MYAMLRKSMFGACLNNLLMNQAEDIWKVENWSSWWIYSYVSINRPLSGNVLPICKGQLKTFNDFVTCLTSKLDEIKHEIYENNFKETIK